MENKPYEYVPYNECPTYFAHLTTTGAGIADIEFQDTGGDTDDDE